jgi:hypothetical protein
MKGDKMTASDEAADDGAAGEAGAPPFDTSVAHQARVYDYLLGGRTTTRPTGPPLRRT